MKICPYCGSKQNILFKINARIYKKCRKCDLIYLDHRKEDEIVLEGYKDRHFEQYAIDQTSGSRDELFENILILLEKEKGAVGRLLDVGTGCGFFLLKARDRGWEIEGIEPSRQSVDVANKLYGLDVFQGTLEEYSGKSKFDVITFINVLDHSVYPWRELQQANILLKPDGLIFLRFPNGDFHSSVYRFASKCGLSVFVQKYLVFHHYAFTPRFIRRLLADCGFEEAAIQSSRPSQGDPYRLFWKSWWAQFVKQSVYSVSKILQAVSKGKILISPSIDVMAVKCIFPKNQVSGI